jgi:hypothetical protein
MTKSIQEISNSALVIRKACLSRSINDGSMQSPEALKVLAELRAEITRRLKERAAV